MLFRSVTLQLTETDEVSGLSVLSTDRSAYEIQLWSGMTMLRSFRTNEPTFQIPMTGLPAELYFVSPQTSREMSKPMHSYEILTFKKTPHKFIRRIFHHDSGSIQLQDFSETHDAHSVRKLNRLAHIVCHKHHSGCKFLM